MGCHKIFQKPHSLEQHQTLKHAVSELIDGDSGNNVVRIIFKTGWIDTEKTPKIYRILKNIGEIRGVQRARQIKRGAKQRRPEARREVHRRRQRVP